VTTNDLQSRLQQLLEGKVGRKHVQSVVVGVQPDEGDVTSTAAGTAWPDGTPMTVETPYYLASITKMYTATVVMKLADDELIDLSASIANYLNADLVAGIHVLDGVDHSSEVLVSQLVNQTSGLADYYGGKKKGGTSFLDDLLAGGDRALSLADIVGIVRELEPEFEPGARGGRKSHYSDTNYALLGAIVEEVTGTRLARLFSEMIFEPLGLEQTFVFDHTKSQPEPAAMFNRDQQIDIPLAMSSFVPDGAIVATVEDSLRFLKAFLGGEILDSDRLDSMMTTWNRIFFPLEYGSGLMRFKLSRWMSPFTAPPDLVGHSGSTGSFAFYDRRQRVFIVGTVNQLANQRLPFQIMSSVLRLVR